MIVLEQVLKKKPFSIAKFEEYFFELKNIKNINNQTLLVCYILCYSFVLIILVLKSIDTIERTWHFKFNKFDFHKSFPNCADFLKQFDTKDLSLWYLRISYENSFIDFSCFLNQPNKPFIRVYSDSSESVDIESLLLSAEKQLNES
jgi:hypothetical protein